MTDPPPRKRQRKNAQAQTARSAHTSKAKQKNATSPVQPPVQATQPSSSSGPAKQQQQPATQPSSQAQQASPQTAAQPSQLAAAQHLMPPTGLHLPPPFLGQYPTQGVGLGAGLPQASQQAHPGQIEGYGLHPLRVVQSILSDPMSPLQTLAQRQVLSPLGFAPRESPNQGMRDQLPHLSPPASALLQMVGGAGLLASPQHMFPQAGGGQRAEVGSRLPQSGPYTRIGPFSMRERYFEEQERLGRLRIEYVYNDGQRQNLIWLTALKNIFSKQLPNMPKEYITRLVFDRRHRSVAVLKQDGTVIGGITYRPFPTQVFGEIAFCAVTASDQVQGYGSRLMSHTKELAKKNDKLTFFLTYADNNAVTFFAKQGFTTEVTTPREQWHGFIKDYDGGTLMECLLQEDLCYTSIAPMIQTQQMALAQKMSTLCSAFTIHPGLDYFRQPNADPLPLEHIPGLKAVGWTEDNEKPPAFKIFVDGRYQEPNRDVVGRFGKFAVTDLQAHDDAVAFLQPVNPAEVPDYADIIKNPMDLSKIEKRLASGKYYITLEIFQADVRLIFRNAKLYNAADTYWYKAASRLEQYFEQYLASRTCTA